MKDWLDSQRIEISCPNCANEIGMTLGQLKAKFDLTCSACGHQISVNAAATLTALALGFALVRLNPAPFCLMDEVDAPLDDSNTEQKNVKIMH